MTIFMYNIYIVLFKLIIIVIIEIDHIPTKMFVVEILNQF